jgi:glycosyltransferase involved in cell wall biosynthesis
MITETVPTSPPRSVEPADAVEVTILMPCLNEAETLEACIRKARRAVEAHGLSAEIVVADNGSTDGSQAIAARLGARVVPVPDKGYGSALRGGIAAARGRYVIMGDADDSYDFTSIQPFVEQLREGRDLVMGNRFKGGIMPGAMPWKHRWIGNPVLSAVGRLFFHCPAGDFHCGLRGFSREAYERMELRATGMEFASEMVIKASLKGMKVAEVPTVLHKDGRRTRPPHLRSWRDGWRHLRFMLLFSPRWLFLVPGLFLFAAGLLGSIGLAGGSQRIGSVVFDIHSLLVAGFLALLGYQLIVFAVFTEIFAITQGFHPSQTHLNKLFRYVKLEVGVVAGLVMTLAGTVLLGKAVWGWEAVGFGELDPRVTMRQAIPAVILLVLGIQTVFASFFLSILGLDRSTEAPRWPS